MKKYLPLFLFIFLFISCSEEDNFNNQTESDIIKYIADNNLNAKKTASGLYYVINKQGKGIKPTTSSQVKISYKGYFLDGSVFEDSNSSGVPIWLNKVISGLTEGLQLFNEGGSGTLIIPSNLGYGDSGTPGIPGGAVLVYDIKLINVIQTEADIIKYIADNNLNAEKTNSGLYYVINKQGTGARPNGTSSVKVAYKGYFLNGKVFDESKNGITFGLNQVIAGWTEGIQLFKEGGEGVLIVPYELAYGMNGRGSIPGGAVLVFDINLIKVN